MIGLLLVMTGAGGFMATQSLLTLPILVPGVVLAGGGYRLLKHGTTTLWLAAMLVASLVPMLFFATALPRTVMVLFGGGENLPAPIFVLGLAALLCLAHATLTIRLLVRSVQREA